MENLNKAPSKEFNNKKIIVALSGGIDSVVLLHWLKKYHTNISAVHINHNISKNANQWQSFCEQLCQELQINLQTFSIQITPKNIEHDARNKRNEIFKNLLDEESILCTAHHQNDQAETLLLQLFRGSGSLGLSAMPRKKKLGKGYHYRPFLKIEKNDIIDYAEKQQLKWIEDDSNKNTHFRRNFIRLEILPKLLKQYPKIHKLLANASYHQAENTQLLEQLAQNDIQQYQLVKNSKLQVKELLLLDTIRIKNVLRYFIKKNNISLPSHNILKAIISSVLLAKIDSQPLVEWGNYQVRKFKNELYFLNKTIKNNQKCPFYQSLKDKDNFNIRKRQGGERCKLKGATQTKTLKKILLEKNIPPWERNNLNLYYIKDKLVAIEKIGEVI